MCFKEPDAYYGVGKKCRACIELNITLPMAFRDVGVVDPPCTGTLAAHSFSAAVCCDKSLERYIYEINEYKKQGAARD